jgi:hypothetical protein
MTYGSLEAILHYEEQKKPKARVGALDKKVAYRMLTQLGLEPDEPGGFLAVKEAERPELFATLVAIGYSAVKEGSENVIRVPPNRKPVTPASQSSVVERLQKGEPTAERSKEDAPPRRAVPAQLLSQGLQKARSRSQPATYHVETLDWEKAETERKIAAQKATLDRLTRVRLPMSPDLLDEPQQATKISESKAAELYSRLSRPKKKEKEEERARTPPPSLAPNQTWRPSTATTDDETAEEREEREAREARDAQERQAELERRREAIERLHAPRTRKKDDISEGVAADSQVLSSLGLRTDLRGRLEADEDLPKMFPDPGRIRLLAQPKKEKKREEAPVAPGPEPDFVEGKRRRPDGGAEPEAEAKPRRSLDVQRMDAMAKPVKPRPKSAERQPPKSEVIVEPLVAYSENLPHRLNPAKPRAVPVPQPAKVTREEQQAQVRRLATRKEKHASE